MCNMCKEDTKGPKKTEPGFSVKYAPQTTMFALMTMAEIFWSGRPLLVGSIRACMHPTYLSCVCLQRLFSFLSLFLAYSGATTCDLCVNTNSCTYLDPFSVLCMLSPNPELNLLFGGGGGYEYFHHTCRRSDCD